MSAGEFSILKNMDAFLLGMAMQASRVTKKENDLRSEVKKTAETLDEKFRDVYDSLIPNIHILDADYTAKLIIEDIVKNPENYFSKVLEEEDGFTYEKPISSENKAFAISAAKAFMTESVSATLKKKIREAISNYHSGLPTSKSGNPIEDLNSAMMHSYSEIQDILSNSNISDDVKQLQVARLGSLFKKNIDSIFSKSFILKATLPGIDDKTFRYIFFSKKFSTLSTTINKKISASVIKALGQSLNVGFRFRVDDSAQIGKAIHFAHTGIKSGTTILLNSPAYSKLIFNVANAPATNTRSPFSSALRASDHFKLKTGHTKVALSVDKNAFSGLFVLMQLGVTITTDHSATLNLLMSKRESELASGKYDNIKEATKATRDLLKNRRNAEMLISMIAENPLFGTSSPSMIKIIELGLIESLSGKKPSRKKYHKNKTKDIVSKYYQPSTPKPIEKANVSVTKKSTATINKTATLSIIADSLTSLQTLLDANLIQQVKQNMGDGSRRDILNLRSGRFAESVKIERLSQSREGMITAFYSYMKNPYATFSRGGQQERPYTRDPKLLISKSIREIASQQVANRLRAVNV